MDYLFKFTFSSKYNKIRNLNYEVYAETKEDLNMFLIQHNFTDTPMDAVTLVPKSEKSTLYALTLTKHIFKSNKYDGLFTVMTCPDFVNEAITSTCNSLNDSMIFGEAIIRRDIEIFKMIGDLVNALPHANVIDFSAADDNSVKDDTITEIVQNKCRNGLSWYEDASTYYSHMSMDMARHNDEPEPITLEAYIESFAGMLVDTFE